MTTEQIRKEVEVKVWALNPHGIHISYIKWNDLDLCTEIKVLGLTPEESLKELKAIGEIDDNADNYGLVKENIFLSQWDALNLVIRHELNKAMDEEIENSDIGKAVNTLLKK